MRVSKDIRDKAVDYSFDSIKYICEEIGPRESGMPNERKAQEWLKDQLLRNGWADEAAIEPFTVSRHGLVGFPPCSLRRTLRALLRVWPPTS